jgi:hypothetical protein
MRQIYRNSSMAGITQHRTNTFNVTANDTWSLLLRSAMPEPASLLLFLTGLPVLGVGWLPRRCRKE